jgi:hypothetical protein
MPNCIKGHDMLADEIEMNYDIKAIESLERGMFYLQDNERKSIGIMTCKSGKRSIAILTKKQAYTLLEEFEDICEAVFGRRKQ